MPCPFCSLDPSRAEHHTELITVLRDAYPVSPGHMLIIPNRHVATWFEASGEEQAAILEAISNARQLIERDHRPDGDNIGMNSGAAAGQTVPHLHLHVIPRYAGDVPDPRAAFGGSCPTRRPTARRRDVVGSGGDLLRREGADAARRWELHGHLQVRRAAGARRSITSSLGLAIPTTPSRTSWPPTSDATATSPTTSRPQAT